MRCGRSAVQGARIAGASVIVGVDVNPLKLEWAQKYGATHVVDASAADPVEVVRALTQGRGADYAIEAAGQTSRSARHWRPRVPEPAS